jgi:hypothetical protein
MRKKLSLTFLITMASFMIATFVTCKFQSGYGNEDKIGYPFVFFSAYNEGEVFKNKFFSIAAFTVDFSIYFIISLIIVTIISMLKVNKGNSVSTRRFVHD